MRNRSFVAAVAGVLVVAACGGGSDDADVSIPEVTLVTTTTTPAPFEPSDSVPTTDVDDTTGDTTEETDAVGTTPDEADSSETAPVDTVPTEPAATAAPETAATTVAPETTTTPPGIRRRVLAAERRPRRGVVRGRPRRRDHVRHQLSRRRHGRHGLGRSLHDRGVRRHPDPPGDLGRPPTRVRRRVRCRRGAPALLRLLLRQGGFTDRNPSGTRDRGGHLRRIDRRRTAPRLPGSATALRRRVHERQLLGERQPHRAAVGFRRCDLVEIQMVIGGLPCES